VNIEVYYIVKNNDYNLQKYISLRIDDNNEIKYRQRAYMYTTTVRL